VFWSWILSALIESLLISILPLVLLENTDNKHGAMDNFLESGMTSFTIIVIVVNTKVTNDNNCDFDHDIVVMIVMQSLFAIIWIVVIINDE